MTQQHAPEDGDMMQFKYDGKEVLDLSYKLTKMHKAAFPNAVRFTLNDAAFDVKKKTLQDEVKKDFILRKPTFFRKFSGVEKATGWNIKNMEASVGMVSDSSVQATQDIEVQETGGKIKRSHIMLPQSRVSKSGKKPVAARYKALGGYKDHRAVTKKDYVKGAFASEGKKKPDHLRYEHQSGRGFFIEIEKITRKASGKLNIKSKILATFDPDRRLDIKATHFVSNAALNSAKKLNDLFRKNATKQIKRYAGR